LFAGIQENLNKIKIFCVDLPTTKFQKLQRRYLPDSSIEFYNVLIDRENTFDTEKPSRFAIFQKKLNKNDRQLLLNALHQNNESSNAIKLAKNTIKTIKQEKRINYFDMVLVGNPKFDFSAEVDEIYGAKFVVIDSINSLSNHNLLHRLLAQSGYTIVAQNLFLRNGYAILKKTDRARTLLTAIDADRLSDLECEKI
jgi:hypothetical protein